MAHGMNGAMTADSANGMPHTEGLQVIVRYRRLDVGHLTLDLTFVDEATFTSPLTFAVQMTLAADTEMIEAVCETDSAAWTGRVGDIRREGIAVAPEILAGHVGTYSGPFAGRPRTLDVTLKDGSLFVSVKDLPSAVPIALTPLSDTLFMSNGLAYQFVRDLHRTTVQVIETHVDGDVSYQRRR